MKALFKLAISLVVIITVVGAGYYFLYLPQITKNKVADATTDKSFGWKFPVAKFPLTGTNDSLIAYSNIRDPGGIPQGLPVRLQIPVIGVDSAIEDAQITPDGRMDVPAGSVNVAWFSLGPHPGSEGSAVIGGHFGITNGVPFVFYKLDKVNVGDKLYIVNDKGETLAFQVRSIKSFDRNADATTVFTSNDGKAHLNLITCEGVWNQVNGTYPLRLVVFSDAIPSEGAVAVKSAAPIATKKPSLPQTAITKPIPTSSPTEMPAVSSVPALTESITIPSVSQTTPDLTGKIPVYIKDLYGTTTDGIISSLLILSIIFIGFKIIRR